MVGAVGLRRAYKNLSSSSESTDAESELRALVVIVDGTERRMTSGY
jgi:hypothetical protein